MRDEDFEPAGGPPPPEGPLDTAGLLLLMAFGLGAAGVLTLGTGLLDLAGLF